jgi:hypothetical protein
MGDQEGRQRVAPDPSIGRYESASFAAGDSELFPPVGAEIEKEVQHPELILYRDMIGDERTERFQGIAFGKVAKAR